jgi:hypothetical protein
MRRAAAVDADEAAIAVEVINYDLHGGDAPVVVPGDGAQVTLRARH